MPVMKGKGVIADALSKLVDELENVTTKMQACDDGSDSLNVVLETSFNALTLSKKRELKKTAVLAPGAVASTEMLLNLWQTEDAGGTREEAEGLVSKSLLQDLSEDPELEAASYCTSLGELEPREAPAEVASSFASVGHFFYIQGLYDEAYPLHLQAIKIG
eukprot:g14248.t1